MYTHVSARIGLVARIITKYQYMVFCSKKNQPDHHLFIHVLNFEQMHINIQTGLLPASFLFHW